MQVHTAPHAKQSQVANSRAFADLIELIGRPGFSGSLFSYAHDMIQADHLTAFCNTTAGGIRTVLAENIGVRPIARAVSERYVKHHWNRDPVHRIFARGDVLEAAERESIVAEIAAADVEHTGYRDECYSSVNLNHRLSIANVRDGKTMRINFYRRYGHGFSSDEVNRVSGITNLLMAIVWRHDEDSLKNVTTDLETSFLKRLAHIEPALSARERQVCALVGLGLTSEGIALRLDIRLNTVLTYRKRAYARMSISSQNELMRRLMV